MRAAGSPGTGPSAPPAPGALRPRAPPAPPAPGPERTAPRGPRSGPGRQTSACAALPGRKPRLGARGSARRGRQQVSPERPADMTHLARGRSERRGAQGQLRGLECGRGAAGPRVIPGAGLAVPSLTERPGAGAAGPARRLLRVAPSARGAGGCSLRLGPRGNSLCRGSPRESGLRGLPRSFWKGVHRGGGPWTRSLGWR